MQTASVKGYKGMGMEGFVARWYAKTTRAEAPEFRREAGQVAALLKPGADVLEVAPGPGYFAIELARLGDFHILGLDISRSFVQLATDNARTANVNIDFKEGNVSAMPLEANSFDFIFCRAAFKNFSEPVKALNEMHRVLRPGGRALIVDLDKDVKVQEIDDYIRKSGRGRIDSFITRWTFKRVLIPRAYSQDDFNRMARESSLGTCELAATSIALEVSLVKNVAHG